MTMLHDRLEALRDLCYKSSPLLLDITTQTLHGTAIYAYIGVVSGVNVGIYIYIWHTWNVWDIYSYSLGLISVVFRLLRFPSGT